MVPTVIVNGQTIVHKKSDGKAESAAPDVCYTPAPGSPAPIAYTNVAYSKDLANGSETVEADGASIALKDSEFASSTGDEPGTAGQGIISGVIKGKAKFISYSMDVKVEKRNVARRMDMMMMNGNAANTYGPELQELGELIGEDTLSILCKAFCWCDKEGNKGKDFVEKLPPGHIMA